MSIIARNIKATSVPPTPFEKKWTPVRRGPLFCSPACGRGCTGEEYKAARTKAALLCRILGDGWEPRVTENLGWHYDAIALGGLLVVNPVGKQFYAAYCPSGDGVCMSPSFISEHRKDPRQAVREVASKIAAESSRLNSILKTVADFTAKPSGFKPGKNIVTVTVPIKVNVEVNAPTEREALDQANEKVTELSPSYVGLSSDLSRPTFLEVDGGWFDEPEHTEIFLQFPATFRR